MKCLGRIQDQDPAWPSKSWWIKEPYVVIRHVGLVVLACFSQFLFLLGYQQRRHGAVLLYSRLGANIKWLRECGLRDLPTLSAHWCCLKSRGLPVAYSSWQIGTINVVPPPPPWLLSSSERIPKPKAKSQETLWIREDLVVVSKDYAMTWPSGTSGRTGWLVRRWNGMEWNPNSAFSWFLTC